MKKLIYFIIAILLSSCVSYQKLSYIEPSGIDSNKWEMKWGKDPLNIKVVNLTRSITDSSGNTGIISFDFEDYNPVNAKSRYFVFELSLHGTIKDNLMKKVNLDSIDSKRINDSLKKKGVYTGVFLPYNKFYLVKNDTTYIPIQVTEFFMGYSRSEYRSFRLLADGSIPDNSKIKILTGDVFLDKILKDSFFIYKRKKLLNIQTGMN